MKSRVFFLLLFWYSCLLYWLTPSALSALYLLLLFARDPLDHQVDIVLFNVDIVERLLCVKGAHDILERYQRVLFFIEDLHIFELTKHAENLEKYYKSAK